MIDFSLLNSHSYLILYPFYLVVLIKIPGSHEQLVEYAGVLPVFCRTKKIQRSFFLFKLCHFARFVYFSAVSPFQYKAVASSMFAFNSANEFGKV